MLDTTQTPANIRHLLNDDTAEPQVGVNRDELVFLNYFGFSFLIVLVFVIGPWQPQRCLPVAVGPLPPTMRLLLTLSPGLQICLLRLLLLVLTLLLR